MRTIKMNLIAALALFAVISVSAQETPMDLSHLIRQSTSTAERELRQRGFVQVSSNPSGNATVSKWWSDPRNECITVTDRNGRIEMILTAPASDCGRSDGGWNSGTPPPSWAIGTWFWNAANQRVMVIEPNGRVTVSQGGINRPGWHRNNRINISGEISTLSQTPNGISLYNHTTGETSNYVQAGSGGGGGGSTRPPNWAVGTWFWNGGTQRIMTITQDGRVSVNSNGNIQNGTYNNGTLNIQGEISNITRNGNDIRTRNRSTGEVSNYANAPSGGGGGGVNPQRPPSWAIGNWIWVEGEQRRLDIYANGNVIAWDGGMGFQGFYSNGIYTIYNQPHTLTQRGNRVRLYNQATGVTFEYRRR